MTNKTNLFPGGPTAVNAKVQVFNKTAELNVFMTQHTHIQSNGLTKVSECSAAEGVFCFHRFQDCSGVKSFFFLCNSIQIFGQNATFDERFGKPVLIFEFRLC